MNLFDLDDEVEGLLLIPLWLTPSDQKELCTEIDELEWSSDLGRRTQHYGYHYNYRTGQVDRLAKASAFPTHIAHLAERLFDENWFDRVPDQCIVNEYLTDDLHSQGISAHRDHLRDFGPVIVTLSLVESWSMRFSRDGYQPVEFLLETGSIAVLTGEARFEWNHAIPPRKFDRNGGVRIPRRRRVSVTFRTVEQ